MNHFNRKKAASVFLISALLVSALPVSASAVEANSGKEEVVYINMGNDGSVREINVVNIFGGNTEGIIVDYGNYLDVRNMTTTDKIDFSGDVIKINSSAEKLYYEGKLESTVMPWEIQIRYFLDDKEYSAEEIAGKSGEIKITICISQNQKYRGDFYDNYALQASLSFDTDKCKNIVAADATVANVGSNKQLTYTILPGKGAYIEITAEVSEFEMDAISINGIPLNLNVEVDDEELTEQITELLDAISQLDDGAAELYDGAVNLKDGGGSLQDGAADLKNGADALDEGIYSLNSGIRQMQEALNTLNEQSPELVNGSASFQAALSQLQAALSSVSFSVEDLSALTEASSAIKSGINDLVSGITALQNNISFEAYKAVMSQNGLDIDGLRQKNAYAVSSLEGLTGALSNQIVTLKNAGIDTSEVESQVSQLTDIISLLGANNASIGGTESYLQTVNSGLSSLLQGAETLQDSYAAFDEKIGELADKIGGLAYRMSELSSAINTLVSEYGKLDQGINGYTEAVAEIVAGYSQMADGAAMLVTGSGELKTGSKSLYSGTGELLSGIAELSDGSGELRDGTSAMREETAGMDAEITDKIDELIETVTGGDFEICSFVSEKNTNVQSVQFVMKTEGIQTAETSEVMEAAPQKLNVWQKFLNLFGLYRE